MSRRVSVWNDVGGVTVVVERYDGNRRVKSYHPGKTSLDRLHRAVDRMWAQGSCTVRPWLGFGLGWVMWQGDE